MARKIPEPSRASCATKTTLGSHTLCVSAEMQLLLGWSPACVEQHMVDEASKWRSFCRATAEAAQAELGGDVGPHLCSYSWETQEMLIFITCLAFVQLVPAWRKKQNPPGFGDLKGLLQPKQFYNCMIQSTSPCSHSQLSAAAGMSSQGSAAGGMIPGILPVELLSSQALSPTFLPQPGALAAAVQTFKLLITLVSAP